MKERAKSQQEDDYTEDSYYYDDYDFEEEDSYEAQAKKFSQFGNSPHNAKKEPFDTYSGPRIIANEKPEPTSNKGATPTTSSPAVSFRYGETGVSKSGTTYVPAQAPAKVSEPNPIHSAAFHADSDALRELFPALAQTIRDAKANPEGSPSVGTS